VRAWLTGAVIGVVSMVAAPAALAVQLSQSSNWSGYAIHRPGVNFRRVSGTWREPKPSCQNGRATFSSYWVGIGGFSPSSRALEQTGTEVDCTQSGKIRAFAWYEAVPAPSHPIKLQVAPGDLIHGQVTVTGHTITVALNDLTLNTHFAKVLTSSHIDVTSAEWIVEAPSQCSPSNCVTLPLANFGSTPFGGAIAQSTTGQSGPILDSQWTATEIKLVGHSGVATPSRLVPGGAGFSVTYSPGSGSGQQAAPRGSRRAGNLVHRRFRSR
jgi:Peptidase A4 family